MRAESDDYEVSQLEGVMKYVGLAVAIIYLSIGIAIVSRSEVSAFLQERLGIAHHYVIAVGVVLMTYGIYRGYRIFRRYFHK